MIVPSDDEIVDVVGTEPIVVEDSSPAPEPLTVENILAKLPPIDRSALEEPEEFPLCTCPIPVCQEVNNITVQIVSEDQEEPFSIFGSSPKLNSPESDDEQTCSKSVNKSDKEQCEETDESVLNCATRLYIRDKYKLDSVSDESVEKLRYGCIKNVNGNFGFVTDSPEAALSENGVNTVPNVASLKKDLSCTPSESFNKYSISIASKCDNEGPTRSREFEFREWHQTLDVESYNGESLRILPYVIID